MGTGYFFGDAPSAWMGVSEKGTCPHFLRAGGAAHKTNLSPFFGKQVALRTQLAPPPKK
jgi:hypothetical protein